MGWGRPFSHEGEFKVSDNLVDNFMIFYERDNSPLLHMWIERIDFSPCNAGVTDFAKNRLFLTNDAKRFSLTTSKKREPAGGVESPIY